TVLLTAGPRQVHFLVALDWVGGPWGRRVMEAACRMARWPTVLRHDAPGRAFRPNEALGLTRRADRDVTALLADGRVVVIFPEGYPNIDPEGSRKPDLDAMLPFRPGFAKLAALAQRRLGTPIPIVPAGFRY